MEKIRHKLLKKIISLFLIIAMGTVSVQSLSFNSEYCKAAAYVKKHGRLKVKGTNIRTLLRKHLKHCVTNGK